jgi:hypothetical protein
VAKAPEETEFPILMCTSPISFSNSGYFSTFPVPNYQTTFASAQERTAVAELILLLSFVWLIVPILILYYVVKHAVREGVKEAMKRKVPSLQATTRVCPHCERGVTEEAKFCPYCGEKL